MFKDRKEAGRLLGQKLLKYKNRKDVVILALPRGGVIVAHEIAKLLDLPFDIIVTRKIGAQENPEYAVAAVGQNIILKNEDAANIDTNYFQKEVGDQRKEIARRLKLYRQDRKAVNIENKIVIIVDDGIATGLTMKAAILETKRLSPKKIIVAVPVASAETNKELEKDAREIIILETPSPFFAIGQFYENFGQVSDEEVIRILKQGDTATNLHTNIYK